MTVDTATEPAASGPLAGADLLEFASVYDTLYRSSAGRIGPRDADGLELWEIAVLLGLADELAPPEQPAPDPRKRQAKAKTRARDLNRQRMAHARGEAPKPEARPLDPAVFNQLARHT